MPTHLNTNVLLQPEDLDASSIPCSPNHVVSHDLAILDCEEESYNPYDSAPRLSDKQLESNFGRRLLRPRK